MRCQQCGFESPDGFAFCGKCGRSLTAELSRLNLADLDHLRGYLPAPLIEALQYDLVSPPPHVLAQCLAHCKNLTETTLSHLPAYVAEQVIANPTPGQTGGKFVDGALLFADISGFTPMSERLSRIGREGAEEVTGIINRYFGVMLDILQAYGGQLVKFGGDALLSLFADPAGATRAALAAIRMQAAMADFTQVKTSQGIFPLRMKVGLRSGRFFAAQVGSAENMEYALWGRDVNAAALAEAAAEAGQICLDATTLAAIDLPCQAASIGPNYFNLSQVAEDSQRTFASRPMLSLPFSQADQPAVTDLRQAVRFLDALTPYLPAGLLPRLAQGQILGMEGEYRLVAVLFANVLGLSSLVDQLGPGHEREIVGILNRYFVAASDAIRRFGGVINKLDICDHGEKLLAFFGAPVAHEDDAERAVRAAQAMHQALASQSLSQKIGSSFGFVYAGYIGNAWRREYTVMGDEVNLAARLMSVTEMGNVTVSQAVQRKVQATFHLTGRGSVALKGKSAPVPAYTVNTPRAIPEPIRGLKGMTSPLVGREKEWAQLLAALQRAVAGRGQIVSITGEAGLGKSRLVAELKTFVTQAKALGSVFDMGEPNDVSLAVSPHNARLIQVSCPSYSETSPYFPFRQILAQIFGLLADDDDSAAWSKLHQEGARWFAPEMRAEVLPYLGQLLGLPLGEMAERVRHLDAEALQRRIFLAVRQVFAAYAAPEAPTLIVVMDDIHWIDQASQALLEFLLPLSDRLPLMWVLLYRPERTDASWQVHERIMREFAHCATWIALEPLTAESSLALLGNLVQESGWPFEIQAALIQRTEGNPLYMEEVLRAWMNGGALRQTGDGSWQLGQEADVAQVPDTLQGVMMSRLDRLDEPSRRSAQIASVVGRSVPFDVLMNVVPINSLNIGECLTHLQQLEVLLEEMRHPELVYSFRHGMMHQVCYGSLLMSARRAYHRKIAEYIENERLFGWHEAENQYTLIAYHAFAGQDWRRALRYQRLAGEQSQRAFANQEAIQHFQAALDSADHLPPDETQTSRLQIHAALGELLTTTGQYDQAEQHLRVALEIARACSDCQIETRACRWLARAYELRGDYSAAMEWITCGLAAASDETGIEITQLRLIAGLIHSRQGNLEQALTECQAALVTAEAHGELAALARAHLLRTQIDLQRGESRTAIANAQRALALYVEAGDLGGQATAHNQIANAYFNTGQWTDADHAYRQALTTFEQLGDVYNQAFANNNLGEIALNQGRYEDALAFYQAALQGVQRIGGSTYVLGVLHNNLGAAYIRLNKLEQAYAELDVSRSAFEQAQSRDILPELHRHLAEAAWAAHNSVKAEALAQRSLALARELEMQNEAAITLRLLGEISLAQNQTEVAKECIFESLRILDELGEEYQAARTRLALAHWLIVAGQIDAARQELTACQVIFTRLDAAPDSQAAQALEKLFPEV
jgi:class 3 adenylate cyclase/tetratricopeptide (TPR) repeat protein